MSISAEERLRQEDEMKGRNIYHAPCPRSLLAAASIVKEIMDTADAEMKQRSYKDEENRHETCDAARRCQENKREDKRRLCVQVAETLAATSEKTETAATAAAISFAQATDRVHSKLPYCRQDEDRHFHAEQQHSLQARLTTVPLPLQEEPTAPLRVPSRRPGRPFRKRERRHLSHESCHASASGRADLLRLASAGLEEEAASAAATGRARDVANLWTAARMQQAPPHGTRQHWTAVAGTCAPSVAASGARDAAAATASAATAPAVAFSATTASSSPPSPRCERRQPLFYPPCLRACSITRVLSSETYLRRLFVTASLAHVLSLDACLPRSLPTRRKVSSRAAGRGGGWGAEEEGERAGCGSGPRAPPGTGRAGDAGGGAQGWGGQGEAGRDDVGAIRSSSNDEGAEPAANAATVAAAAIVIGAAHDSSVSFKRLIPVTLIDSAGQLWSMTYVTTTRDNLHSGRLVDGWEKFCFANGLRIGDVVEFTRVEAHEEEGGRCDKEAVAKVIVHKKRCRNR